jgi:hypothetical protein
MSVVLITGAATGIGNLTAQALATDGHTVYASMRDPGGRNATHAADLLAAARRDGTDLRVTELDVQSQESAGQAVKTIIDQAGQLDTVVHNAGGARRSGPQETSAGFHAGAADGGRPRPARQDHRLRGLTARRHLTNVLSRIVPRWIASCFLPRTSGTKGGRFGARSACGRSARTRPPMKQACLRLPARVHLAVTGGALLRAATAAMQASSAAPLAPGTRSLKVGRGFRTSPCHHALLSGAGADPSARGERRHQCRASDGGFVRGFSLDLDGASLSATPPLARRRRNETVTQRSKQ